jgi:DNA phosphorothioation-dependent restriction protein DptH
MEEMNLYIESLANYLKNDWDRTFETGSSPKEIRYIIQSLDPESLFELFQSLDTHRLEWMTRSNLKCYFKVATNLWRDWCRSGGEVKLDQRMASLGAVGPNGERQWIDEEDRFTWYRNRTTLDEGVDRLVIVLVGLNHATDQGGLNDFHRVDENRIWREMGESFLGWLHQIDKRLASNTSDSEFEQFNLVLKQLFQVRPLRLGKLADFLQRDVILDGQNDSFSDVCERFFRQLPFWDIPPLFAGVQPGELRGKKGASALRAADAFISHQRYKTLSGQKKDWKKLEKWLEGADFELPASLEASSNFADRAEYSATLHAFIFEADAVARERLLRSDLMPVLRALGQREDVEPRPESKSNPAFNGMSLEVLLQGVWLAIDEVVRTDKGQPLTDKLAKIDIALVRFDHDLVSDNSEGIGANDLARELLLGCLGGLDRVFSNIDCRLPKDEDQALLPRNNWEIPVPITLDLALDTLVYGASRARPSVQFKVSITSADDSICGEPFFFRWVLSPTQPERVRYECAKKVRGYWSQATNPLKFLPAFRIPSVAMTALYFAADEDEGNRLVTLAMADLRLVNLLDGLPLEHVDNTLWDQAKKLVLTYRTWLDSAVTEGYYIARAGYLSQVLTAYTELAERVLDPQLLGSSELLRRLYKAFLLVDERVDPNDPYLAAAVVWGLSPAVLELTQARLGFLADGFPEAVGELAIGRDGKIVFERLLDLAQMHRPLAALVVDSNRHLSASIKSFGLLHYLGPEPSAAKSLAVQTLLRDEESDDDEDVANIVRSCEERALVARVLEDYQQLYPFAEDGLRLLAVNVSQLQTILAGVDLFLDTYLKRTSADWPPFHCTVMVYSTSSSPMAMENRLALWRNHVEERQKENGRPLVLSVGHRYARDKDTIVKLLDDERQLYDIAFLFHFLRGGLTGHADPALPFEYNFSGWSGLQFPIAEYPRPIQQGDRHRRQSLLSNRRLRIQSKHADLSARICYVGNTNRDHVIYGQVDYKPWASVVRALHRRAQWTACVDPFVDKRLLGSDEITEQRKIVGFASGLGAYGELNLTISTEQDTLRQLTGLVAGKLTGLLPFEQPDGFEAMAVRVVSEAEEIIGLSSLRAVVGIDERIREVVGFSAIRRALAVPSGQMSQLIPIDSVLHWFAGSDVTHRPDLLQLTLEVRPDDIPLVHAVLIECKLAQQNQAHLEKAFEQVKEGLRHLTGLLAPMRSDLRRLGFDRRYWWAQLHRAITSRSVVSLPQQEWKKLDHALESLAEGNYEICWHGFIFTFWTDNPGTEPEIKRIVVPNETVSQPFEVPVGFAIHHVALGYKGLSALFGQTRPAPLAFVDDVSISLRPERATSDLTSENAQNVPHQETTPTLGSAIVASQSVASAESTASADESLSMHTSQDGGIETSAEQISVSSTTAQTIPESHPTLVDPPPGGALPIENDISSSASSTAAERIYVEPASAFPVPEKITIGTRSNGEPVYWHFGNKQLVNRHLLIFGAAGSGKTYGIQCILAEMAKQQLRSIIVDYTDGFLPDQVEETFTEVVAPKNHYVAMAGLPLNPFHAQKQKIDPAADPIPENPFQIATRIESIFASVFAMGDQQSAALIRVLQLGIEENPNFTLSDLLPRLEGESSHGQSLANKLAPLINAQPFREGAISAWEGMLQSQEHWVHVLQLKGLANSIQQLVTEFTLWDLWDYAQNTGSKSRPIPLVLDEIQNLDHRSGSPIDKMLREGRKFGLGLILATQTTSQFNQEQRDRLFQAGHKLFFKPATTEIASFAQLIAQSTPGVSKADWQQRLASLQKGQCWSLGPVLKSNGTLKEEPVLVSVTSLEDRFGEISG